mmetsp:Transcript_10944/g.11983  ORF Transcript_10944/g.11983 Transcript_10944/m.11983 type:complete len:89 (+) Transcript_10944:887-1153(+)
MSDLLSKLLKLWKIVLKMELIVILSTPLFTFWKETRSKEVLQTFDLVYPLSLFSQDYHTGYHYFVHIETLFSRVLYVSFFTAILQTGF